MEGIETIKQLLNNIYGEVTGRLAFERISPLIENVPAPKRKKQGYFSQEDVILITYGDSLKKEGQDPIATLHEFCRWLLGRCHIRYPFFALFPVFFR